MFKNELVLRPNCLITRRPLKFISPEVSLFSIRPFNKMINYLYQHGYEVQLVKKSIPISNLDGTHVFCTESTYLKHEDHFKNIKNYTMTVMSLNEPVQKKMNHYNLKIQNYRSEDSLSKILDHCVYLAELDFYD